MFSKTNLKADPCRPEPYVAQSQTHSSRESRSLGSLNQKNLDKDWESGLMCKLRYAVLISVVIAKAKLKNLSKTHFEELRIFGPFIAKRLKDPDLCGAKKLEVGRIFFVKVLFLCT